MLRTVLAIGFAIHVGLFAGGASEALSRPCAEQCPDDDSDGKCGTNCVDCTCCPHSPISFETIEVEVPEPLLVSLMPAYVPAEPPCPDPGEILHVPKIHLA